MKVQSIHLRKLYHRGYGPIYPGQLLEIDVKDYHEELFVPAARLYRMFLLGSWIARLLRIFRLTRNGRCGCTSRKRYLDYIGLAACSSILSLLKGKH